MVSPAAGSIDSRACQKLEELSGKHLMLATVQMMGSLSAVWR